MAMLVIAMVAVVVTRIIIIRFSTEEYIVDNYSTVCTTGRFTILDPQSVLGCVRRRPLQSVKDSLEKAF